MKSTDAIPFIEAIREEGRLVHRAKAGDGDAFVKLYDAYGDDVYRYIYFRVLNDVAAEAMTAHVFRHAWNHLDDYQKRGSTFVRWIYTIARNQVIVYYQVNIKADALEIGCLPVAADYGLSTDARNWTNRAAWNARLRLLTAEKEHGLHQTATLIIMRRSLDHLSPGRKPKPSPTFNAYTRAWLTRYLQYHARTPKRSPVVERLVATYSSLAKVLQFRVSLPRLSSAALGKALQFRVRLPKLSPVSARMSLTYATLMAALLFTGTAEAQSALPGDPLYAWKRTSEQAWLSLSPDPVGTGITIANRRLNEWIAVQNDPARSNGALDSYIAAVNDLGSVSGTDGVARVTPVLESHRRKLHASGLASAQVDTSITLAENPSLAVLATQTLSASDVITATVASTEVATTASPTVTAADVATEIAATAKATTAATATELPPTSTATATPTEIPPTPTPTVVPTQLPPTATPTDVPTEVVPTATQVPATEAVPTATDLPPQAALMPAEVPPP